MTEHLGHDKHEAVMQWQSRPLDTVYLSIGINRQGEKEVLGLWIAQTEGAKFWLAVVTELKNRGVADIFNCRCRWLKGFGFGRRNAA